ncbi:MAG: pantoate--beta-alanine ligase [Anaerolineae bacterium]|nr:pantoate--beta-alanine ligase [Anaerolineae bacterium]
MEVVDSIESLRALRASSSGRIGLVPTMGALHAGHLKLVEEARRDNEVVFVSIFINPTQFAANEDLSKYPRDLPKDLDMLRAAGVDVVFTPTPALMYPPGFQTWVQVTDVSQGLEGARRPEHFKGVATVVSKLFNLFQPHNAYFGQKDAQQVAVIKRMARDLNFPLEIIVIPTEREADGLAMSSRNAYLSPDQRVGAGVIYRAINAAAEVYELGERAPFALRQAMMYVIMNEPLAETDYISVADAATLQELDAPSQEPLLISLTVKFGRTRLLDNMLLPAALNTRAGLTGVLGG